MVEENMKSYEFEIICKNEIIKELKEKFKEDFKVEELHLVWFSKNLQNLKCCICDSGKNDRYYECTFNGDKQELYVDIYNKVSNKEISLKYDE